MTVAAGKLPADWDTEPVSASSDSVYLVHTTCGTRSTRTYHPVLDGSWVRSYMQYHLCPEQLAALPSRLQRLAGQSREVPR